MSSSNCAKPNKATSEHRRPELRTTVEEDEEKG